MGRIEANQVVRYPLKFRMLEVRRVTKVTPHMVRVTFGGDDLAGFESRAADDHVKLFFPLPGQERPPLPSVGPDGVRFPEGEPRPPSRDFTPRRYDPQVGALEIDFVIHGDGPASSWAAAAKPGMFLGMGGPRGSRLMANDFDWYLFVGDETALPAIGRRLEELPAGVTAIVIAEVADAAEEQPLATEADLAVTWVHRNGVLDGSNSPLEQAVREVAFPEGRGFIWAAGEAITLRGIRRHLLYERGVPRENTRFTGHWKRGVVNWDHHEPIDDDEATAKAAGA